MPRLNWSRIGRSICCVLANSDCRGHLPRAIANTGQRAGTSDVGAASLWGGDVMADIERRAFVKGATLGALAFTVSGSTAKVTARPAPRGHRGGPVFTGKE